MNIASAPSDFSKQSFLTYYCFLLSHKKFLVSPKSATSGIFPKQKRQGTSFPAFYLNNPINSQVRRKIKLKVTH